MTEKQGFEMKDETKTGNAVNRWPALTIDYALYEQYLDDADLSEEQKREFIETLWNIIVSFVDLGFGVHPLQQATSDGCEQDQILADLFPPDSNDMVECDNNSKIDFNGKADAQSGTSPERS